MLTQIFDDGSAITTDAGGNVVRITNSAGQPQSVPPPGGSGVVQQFSELFHYGVRAAIDRVTQAPQPAPQPAAGSPVTVSPLTRYVPLLLVAAAALAAYKLLK